MDNLTTKNFKALSDGLKSERTKNENLAKKVRLLEQTISQTQNDMALIKAQLSMVLAGSMGSGPTT